ncbi:MAG: beta-lactamase family protein, partial [Gammaproteobacteria bacterium]|nr:beta-lactamase family protein [Gammaproteobacteria bacterium]
MGLVRSAAVACALLGFALHAPARQANPGAAAESYVRAEMRVQGIPGVALGVLRGGRPIYVRGFGVATLEQPVAVGPDTRFQIGSIGKQFTAVAVMMLAREGRLSLDDPLAKYLPEIPASWGAVTLRLMLNHQSGIPQLTAPGRDLLDLHHDYSDEEYLRLASTLPLDFEPGTDASYSDTAYVLLGFVIGRVAGKFYGDLLAARVFAPLHMLRTRIVSDADIIPGRASGYQRTASGALRNQDYVSPALNRTADGSLYSTVLDLARWDAALYGNDILPQRELRRMWNVDALRDGRQPLLHYGYGWEINSLRGHEVVEYDGNWQG